MCSRTCLLLILLLARPALAAAPGGHPLELGVGVGFVDFDDEIRFQNDESYALAGRMGFASWMHLSLELSRMTMRDTLREAWSEAVTFAMRFELEPRPALRVSPLGSLGVSFMAFDDTEVTDSISEGLDLGVGVRWAPSSRWNLRVGALLRMQTFRVVQIDSTGEPLDRPVETGRLWSRLFQLGLSRVF